ncbi:acyl-CoA dehydrogenase family protein [Mycobacterium sp.]|uniref:acyl-CoA dehydrogenase family protein n=1 Tax=Mycobacterium sp. TaxID=1785 RepID=UPI002C39C4AA|nr:acyl-CoA dehydrogenase family protein [Mycobacterium sp.]HXB89782.1 acyl-CoA dehydrogenase family protein [Mycobacterium sp.]
MIAELTADQRSLRELAQSFLTRKADAPAIRAAMQTSAGYEESVWQEFAHLGLCGLGVPARYGGADCGPVEIAIVMRELGRRLAPLPYFSSVALAQTVVMQSGDSAACERLLPDLAAGQRRAAVALVEPSWKWDPTAVQSTATQHQGQWRITGKKMFVVDGATADVILLAARGSSDITLFEVSAHAAGLTRTALTGIDQTRRLASIELRDTPAHQVGDTGAAIDILSRALTLANVYLAAESVGATEHVLACAIDYAKTRTQFGRPIGSFQAIKHKCADMHVDYETSRSTMEHAVLSAAEGGAEEARVASTIAAALCHDAFLQCAAENIQVHGGIGFTWEHDAHLYYKRAQANRLLLGDDVYHRQSLAVSLGFEPAQSSYLACTSTQPQPT